MDKFLTLVIVDDNEKDPRLLDYCVQAIEELNGEAGAWCERIILWQACPQPTPGWSRNVYCPAHARVGDTILWDMMGALAGLLPSVKSEYLLVIHKECLLGPGYLSCAREWLLHAGKPAICLGNMRRLGHRPEMHRRGDSGKRGPARWSSAKPPSDRIRAAFDTGNRDAMVQAMITSPVTVWNWSGVSDPATGWREDIFFARTDWLRASRFFEHGDRMLFQDIYDPMSEFLTLLARYSLMPGRVAELPANVQAFHLWHEKAYPHFTSQVCDYFRSDPARWTGTNFLDSGTWGETIAYLENPDRTGGNPVARFRRERGGTLTRYMAAAKAWLRARPEEYLQWLKDHAPSPSPS